MPTTTRTQEHQQTRIPNPRRLLILSPSSHSPTTIPPFLHALTGTPVLEPPSTTPSNSHTNEPESKSPPKLTFAGYTTHPPLLIRNRYYVAEVPVWVDEIALVGEDGLTGTTTTTTTTAATSATPATATATETSRIGAEAEAETDTEAGTATGAEAQAQAQADTETETGDPITTPGVWKREFSGPEAQVVRDAIGAVVLCFVNPTSSSSSSSSSSVSGITAQTESLKDFLRAIGDVRALIEEERGGMGDVPGLVVLVGGNGSSSSSPQKQKQTQDPDLAVDLDADADAEAPFSVPWWEDQLYEMGLIGMEVVSWDPKGEETEERNHYGEYQGMRRIREVLETHDWAPTSSLSDDEADKDGAVDDEIEKMLLGADDDEDTGFGLEVNELEREMVGLRFAIERGGGSGRPEDSQDEGDDELRVDAVEALMLRMAAIRDMSDDLPEHERKRFAAKAVRDIMKEI